MSNAYPIPEFEWPTYITDRIKYFPRELKPSTNVPNGVSSGSNCTKDTNLCPYVSNTIDTQLVQPRSVAPYVWTRNVNPLRYPAVVGKRAASVIVFMIQNVETDKKTMSYLSKRFKSR